MNNWTVWNIFMSCHSITPFNILLFFMIFFMVCNVSRFFNSGYLNKKFIVFCHAYLTSKTDLENVLYVVSDYSPFFRLFLNIPNHWSLGVLFTAGLKGFLGGVYYSWFLVFIFELIFFYPKSKNLLLSWFIDGSNMFNHLIIPRNQKNVTWFCYIWGCIRLLIDKYMIILAWNQRPYNWDFFFCINSW